VENENLYTELVLRIRRGDEGARQRLAACVRGPLQAYVYRITMRDDLTQDIVQESILEMLKILGKLNEADRFWPWLCKIALNKVRNHHRIQDRRKRAVMSKADMQRSSESYRNALEDLVTEEFKQIVRSTMDMLQPKHRAVLSMRCYEDMSYAQIAEIMDSSELNVRLMFYRGKKQLQRHLSRQGFGRGALLSALVVFGKMTAPDTAAAAGIAVLPSTVKVGAIAAAIGALGTKTAVISLSAAAVITTGAIVASSPSGGGFDAQLPAAGFEAQAGAVRIETEDESYEQWHFFPEGTDGPVMMRVIRIDDAQQAYCQWLQNDSANYHYETGSGSVRIANHRSYNEDLSVRRLPTDSADLTAFLNQIEGRNVRAGRLSNEVGGLLIITAGERMDRGRLVRNYDVLQEEHFRYGWPGRASKIDQRDAMHVQGYCRFTVAGELGGQAVEGSGFVPLYYGVSKSRPAWVSIRAGEVSMIDDGEAAAIVDAKGDVLATYAGGTFMRGLARPWMGLHTVDTVRRDSAEYKTPFETRFVDGRTKAEVVLKAGDIEIVYRIDMQNDLVESVAVHSVTDGRRTGQLKFAYSEQEADSSKDGFVRLRVVGSGKHRESLWLVDLARDGKLRQQ